MGGGAAAGLPLAERVLLFAFVGACGGALFVFFGEGMRFGGGTADGEEQRATRADANRAFVAGFVAAILIAFLGFVAMNSFSLLIQALFGFLSESAETSSLGWTRLQNGLSLALGLLFAGCGALLVAMSPSRVARARRIASVAIAAVPIVARVATAAWFKNYCRTVGEMGTTFAQAAHLEPVPAARLMILPGGGGDPARAYRYPMTATLPGFTDELVGATIHNVELAQRYNKRLGGRWTSHSLAAWELPAVVYDLLLEPAAALRARADAAEATGSVLSAAMIVAKIPRMPRSDTVQSVSERLLDPARFTAGPQARIRLSRVALAAGDLARAQTLWQQGAPLAGGTADTAMRKPEALVAYDRVVTGSVELPAAYGQGARVALYRQSDASAPTLVPSALALVAARAPDAHGTFSFDGLPPAFYSVGILLPQALGSDPQRVKVEGALRVVNLSADRTRDSVGSIRVSLRQ